MLAHTVVAAYIEVLHKKTLTYAAKYSMISWL